MGLPDYEDLERIDKPTSVIAAAESQDRGRQRTIGTVETLHDRDEKLIEEEMKEIVLQLNKKAENPEIRKKIINQLIDNMVKKVPTQSALNSLKKLLQDKILIDEMKGMAYGNQNPTPAVAANQNAGDGSDDILQTLLMANSMKGPDNDDEGGNDILADPTLLSLLMNKKGNSGMNPAVLFSLLNVMANKNKGRNNNNSVGDSQAMLELVKALTTQEQKPAVDPNLILILKALQGNQKPIESHNSTENMIKMMELVSNSTNQQIQTIAMLLGEKFERLAEQVGGSQTDPMEQFNNYWGIFKDVVGDKRERTKDEMQFDLEKEKLKIEQQKHIDALDRQERADDRETQKSENMIGAIKGIADTVLGEGTQALVKEVMKGSRKKKRGSVGGGSDLNDINTDDFMMGYDDE